MESCVPEVKLEADVAERTSPMAPPSWTKRKADVAEKTPPVAPPSWTKREADVAEKTPPVAPPSWTKREADVAEGTTHCEREEPHGLRWMSALVKREVDVFEEKHSSRVKMEVDVAEEMPTASAAHQGQ